MLHCLLLIRLFYSILFSSFLFTFLSFLFSIHILLPSYSLLFSSPFISSLGVIFQSIYTVLLYSLLLLYLNFPSFQSISSPLFTSLFTFLHFNPSLLFSSLLSSFFFIPIHLFSWLSFVSTYHHPLKAISLVQISRRTLDLKFL